MTVFLKHDEAVGELRIFVEGRFDFAQHYAFRSIYEEFDKSIKYYVIDLSKTTYLDSSALGMMLLLRDYAGGDTADVRIENVNDEVSELLSISNFSRLFKIKDKNQEQVKDK
jgi:anti-anti-sigma factor